MLRLCYLFLALALFIINPVFSVDVDFEGHQFHFWKSAAQKLKNRHWSVLCQIDLPSGPILTPMPRDGYYPYISTFSDEDPNILTITDYSSEPGSKAPTIEVKIHSNYGNKLFNMLFEGKSEEYPGWKESEASTYSGFDNNPHASKTYTRGFHSKKIQHNIAFSGIHEMHRLTKDQSTKNFYRYKTKIFLMIYEHMMECRFISPNFEHEATEQYANWQDNFAIKWGQTIIAANALR